MRPIKVLLCFIFLSVSNQSINAQFWKKLKQKVENKIDQKADKTIDDVLNGKQKNDNDKDPAVKDERLKSYGSASINHSVLYGTFSVNDLGQTGVEKKGNEVSITGSWRTFSADVFDGYILKIKNVDDINSVQNKTYKIPEEASLELSYNALVKGKYEYKRGQIHAPQSLEVSSGSATVTFIKNQNVSLNFSGSVKLSDHNKGDIPRNDTPATINGMINTSSPKYSITKEMKENSKKTKKATEAEEAEFAKAVLEKVNPTDNIPSIFSFNKQLTIEITDFRNETQKMKLLLGNYPDIYGIDTNFMEGVDGQGNSTMVMTPKASIAFVDMAGMKMKKATSLDQLGNQFEAQENLPENGDFEYKKTGNTKTILGYTCHEYKVNYNYTNSKGYMSFWVSKDFPIQNKALPMLGMQLNNPNFSGFVLEMSGEHQGKTTTLKVVDIADKNLTINSKEYRKIGY